LKKRLCPEAVRLPAVAVDAGGNRQEATPGDTWCSLSEFLQSAFGRFCFWSFVGFSAMSALIVSLSTSFPRRREPNLA
jgi:hypothetical protein